VALDAHGGRREHPGDRSPHGSDALGPPLEQDGRFPSGPWTGFFLQRPSSHRHWMELRLSFRAGSLRGDGLDMVGPFVVDGHYDVRDGRCWWTKRYIGQHDVSYRGYNEGRGIWGMWEIQPDDHGAFTSGRPAWATRPSRSALRTSRQRRRPARKFTLERQRLPPVGLRPAAGRDGRRYQASLSHATAHLPESGGPFNGPATTAAAALVQPRPRAAAVLARR